jgi:hypothetical protein
MPHNNPGYDIRLGLSSDAVRYFEVKGTTRAAPHFFMSEGERLFAEAHTESYTLVCIYGIDLDRRTGVVHERPGMVQGEGVELRPVTWEGWVILEREPLGLSEERLADSGVAAEAPPPSQPTQVGSSLGRCSTQQLTDVDIRAGRIRVPRPSKHLFPAEPAEVEIEIRSHRRRCRYDPRRGPDRERSGVLLVGKQTLEELVVASETLTIQVTPEFIKLS